MIQREMRNIPTDSLYCVWRSKICDKNLWIYEPFWFYESDLFSDRETFIKMSTLRDPDSGKCSGRLIVLRKFSSSLSLSRPLVTWDHFKLKRVISVISRLWKFSFANIVSAFQVLHTGCIISGFTTTSTIWSAHTSAFTALSVTTVSVL